MLWNVEYPEQDQPLYANVNAAGGWCLHDSEPIQSITLYLDGRRESDAILGYPRLDVNQAHPEAGSRSLLSGFRCEFDAARLAPGMHDFEFRAQTVSGCASYSLSVQKARDTGPIHVSDLFIDIVGACNLRCAMCPHGGHEGLAGSRSAGVMPPRLFERILARLQESSALGDHVNLYNWGEPLLHPELGAILDVCRRFGVKAILSTNLSLPRARLEPLMTHPVELLMVSISGFTQDTHARNHRGGTLQRVLENLKLLASRRSTIRTVLLKYLVFDYNRHEVRLARRFAEAHGFAFGAYAGAIPSVESHSRLSANDSYARLSEHYVDLSESPKIPTRSCPQETKIVVDHEGRLEHCSMSWNRPFGRPVLEANISSYLIDKLSNRRCKECLRSGYSHYRHFGAYTPEFLQLSTSTRS